MNAKLAAQIHFATLVRAAPERVYDAFTTSQGLDGWFTSGASVDPRPGGEILFNWEDFGPDGVSGEDGGPVLEAERPRRFVFQWQPDNTMYSTTVELEFEAVPDGTVVRLREYGYEDTPRGLEAMLDCSAGWGEALTLLKFYVEHGIRY